MLVADRTVSGCGGRPYARRGGAHSLCKTLVTLGVERVAIERPDGLLIERLLDAGLTVLAIHPNQVAAARRGSVPLAGNPTGSTRSCCASSPAPTSPLPGTGARQRSDQGAAGTHPRPRRPGRAARRAVQPAPRRARTLLARRRANLQRSRQPDQPGVPRALPLARSTRTGLARRPSPGFSPATTTADARTPASCSPSSARAPAGRAGEIEADARRGLVLALVGALKPIVEQIRLLTAEIAHAVRAHPDGEIFLSFFKAPTA